MKNNKARRLKIEIRWGGGESESGGVRSIKMAWDLRTRKLALSLFFSSFFPSPQFKKKKLAIFSFVCLCVLKIFDCVNFFLFFFLSRCEPEPL